MTQDDASETKKRDERVSWDRAWPLYKRFARWLKPDLGLGIWISVCLVLAVPAGVVSPELVRRVFDDALKNGDVDQLKHLGIWILAFTLTAHLLRLGSALLGAKLKMRVSERIARELFEHVLRLPLRYFHKNETGYIMARLREDVHALDALMTDTLAHAIVDAGRAILFFVLLLFTDLGLALSGLGLLTLIVIGVLLFNKPLRERSEKAAEEDAKLSGGLHQALTGVFTVRVTAQEEGENRRFGGSLRSTVEAMLRRDRLHVGVSYVIGLAVALGTYAILTIGAFRILKGSSTVGSLFQFSIYLMYVAGAVTSLMGLNPALQRAFVSLKRIYAILDEPRESMIESPHAAEALRGRVCFENVSMRYDEEHWALRNIDLAVDSGEVVALVGRSGSGKTTLVHLVARLYDPVEGRITIDDVDLREYDLHSLRSRIGVVPQDVFLFNRSIRENIAYGRPDADDAEIRAAAIAANADEFIRRLPKGYDTLVGERGVKLSGGERQRIAIAREIVRDPPILILDEATSSLDSESEALIRDAVDRLKADRTCFVIAHRLSTVVGADRIVVLDRGRIVETGTHAELLAKDGAYRRLYVTQFGSTEGAYQPT